MIGTWFRMAQQNGKAVHEIPIRLRLRLRPLVGPVRQKGMRKAKLLVEVADFFVLGFEVVEVGMGQNEVQDQQPGADEFVGKAAAIAGIVLVYGFIEGAREEIVDQGVTGEPGGSDVAMFESLDGQAAGPDRASDSGQAGEQLLGEVARAGGAQEEEGPLGGGVRVAL